MNRMDELVLAMSQAEDETVKDAGVDDDTVLSHEEALTLMDRVYRSQITRVVNTLLGWHDYPAEGAGVLDDLYELVKGES